LGKGKSYGELKFGTDMLREENLRLINQRISGSAH